MLTHFSCVRLFATVWTLAQKAPLSVGFSRQEYWSGPPCPPPGDLPDPDMLPASLSSPALAGRFLLLVPPKKPLPQASRVIFLVVFILVFLQVAGVSSKRLKRSRVSSHTRKRE